MLLRDNIKRQQETPLTPALIQYLNTPLQGRLPIAAADRQAAAGRIPVENSRFLISKQWGLVLRERKRATSRSAAKSSLRHDQAAHDLIPSSETADTDREPGHRTEGSVGNSDGSDCARTGPGAAHFTLIWIVFMFRYTQDAHVF